jgi:uncharacterized protein (TIRG00374 family)
MSQNVIPRRIHIANLLKVSVSGALAIGLVIEGFFFAPYLRHAFGSIHHLDFRWMALAVGAEMLSMAAFARLQRRMLTAGGMHVRITSMVAVTYASNALSVSLPAGAAVASGYRLRRLRALGASAPLATFVLVTTGVLSTVALALLGLGGLLAGGGGVGIATICTIAAIGVAGLIVRHLVQDRSRLLRIVDSSMAIANRLRRREATNGTDRAHDLVAQLATITPRRRDWAVGLLLATANWLADLVCLILSCHAVGITHVTIGVALVGYLAAMAASTFSILPGGLGIVDATLILALVRGGVAAPAATAAVLLYRIISLGFVALVGWVVWAGTWRRSRLVARLPMTMSLSTSRNGSPS